MDYLPFFDERHPAQSIATTLAALRRHVARYPGQHAALWCEFVQGEGGFYPGSRDFFAAPFAIARDQHIAVVADEVQTFGRTSRLFAFQHFGVEELIDIVTVGKMLQVCATLFTDAFRPAPGLLSQTFTASTSAILAADASSTTCSRRNSSATPAEICSPRTLRAALRGHRPAASDWISGPYGLGGMVALHAVGRLAKRKSRSSSARFRTTA